jgi:transketolase
MLNFDLKLNENVFNEGVVMAPTRDGFGEGLMVLGEQNPNVVGLSADLTESTKMNKFAEAYPERFFEIGIGEQNMAAVAAGLGVSGKTAFISSYATFSPGKNWETIRTSIVYNNADVKVAGHHAGTMTGPDGATHQATEDIAITRCWPGMKVFVPCDAIQAKKVTIASASFYGPAYLRFSRDKTPQITTEETPFEIGKVQEFWKSDGAEVTIFATGYMVYYALVAAKALDTEGLRTLVVNVPTIKPLDQDGMNHYANHTHAFVTVEDHQVAGGLGGAIAEWAVRNNPIPVECIGLQDTFAESGTPKEILEKYGMGVNAIKEAVKRVKQRKG